MIIKNTTIQNKTKKNRLSTEHIIPSHCIKNENVVGFLKSLLNYNLPKENIIFSIGCELVNGTENHQLKRFLNEYNLEKVKIANIPCGEFDLLGTVYQYLNSKIENLEKGSFYTGYKIAYDFVHDLDFSLNQIILDPACGSGSFLFSSNASPTQIFGVDNDPIAIMIAKFNYFIKFPDADYPNLFCDDFFIWYSHNENIRFDYIIGNPPYGANLNLSNIGISTIKSGESFSYFIEFSFKLLKKSGILRFLLPESILNVKKHYDIRSFVLTETNLRHIKKYYTKFSGVMSDLYMLELDNNEISNDLLFTDNVSVKMQKSIFKSLKNKIFTCFTEYDISIIEKVKKVQKYNLSNSIFALGVVTGNNKEKLLDVYVEGAEPIYTGKEVTKYKLLSPKKYIIFDRDNLQQVAADEIYRANKKLVYKTINNYIKVAIDTTGSLTSNSANILIPTLSHIDIHTIMALLNSNLYSYLNVKLFGGVNKISKENLQNLPIPHISTEDTLYIKQMVEDVMQTGDDTQLQSYINKNIFALTDDQIEHINCTVGDI
jgi:hypothetical protein